MTGVGRTRITLVKGSAQSLARYARAAAERGSLVLPASRPGSPYAMARALLTMACERAGSLVEEPETPPDSVRRAMLPRADANDGQRLDAWMHALAFALDGEDVPVVVFARRVDLSSLRLLRPTWRSMSSPPPLIVLNAPRDVATGDPDDPVTRALGDLATEEIAQLRALPWTRREVLTNVDGALVRAVEHENGAPVPVPDRAFDHVRRAFGEHAFDASLVMGRALLAHADACTLAPAEIAELHAICALSATSLGHASVAALVDEHLYCALAGPLGPDARACALLVRCSTAPSLDASRKAIDASRRCSPAIGRYVEAWGRRARAAQLTRAGRSLDAIDDLESAIALLSAAPLDVPLPEIHRTQHVLALDLSRAVASRRDGTAAAAWSAQASACASLLPPGWTLPRTALDLKVERARLEDAIREREIEAARARAEWDPLAEAAILRELSSLHGCLGHATRSHACARLAKRIAEAARADTASMVVAELACAHAAYRAGMLDAAAAGLESSLGGVATSGEQAEIHGLLACIAAKRNQVARAEDASLEALARLDANAPADVAARVLARVGEAYLLLDRADAARRVFALARGWSDAGARDAIRPAERLALILGMWDSGARDRELTEEALGCASDALLDPDAWWLLPRLLTMLAGIYLDVDDELLDTLVEIRALAAQRRPSDVPPATSQASNAEQPQKKPFLHM